MGVCFRQHVVKVHGAVYQIFLLGTPGIEKVFEGSKIDVFNAAGVGGAFLVYVWMYAVVQGHLQGRNHVQ